VVTIGETMALMSGESPGPLKHNRSLTLGIGGSESNVAIALARLGVAVTWIGKVGADSLGDLVLNQIAGEGVHVVGLRDASAPTALMIKERRTPSETRIWYYRRGMAGSRLCKDDIDFDLLRNASLLHITGISLALSNGLSEVVAEAARVARQAGVPVSFDFNHRSKLWSRADAAAAFERMLPLADLVFAGDDEARILIDAQDPVDLASGLIERGASESVIKMGAKGAVAVSSGRVYVQAAIPIVPVDTVGAGDAFVAGYLSELLNDKPIPERLLTGAKAGAYACLTHGDWEGLPTRDELDGLHTTEPVSR
jgi:2-dehydro-3-deoxygluconokinase